MGRCRRNDGGNDDEKKEHIWLVNSDFRRKEERHNSCYDFTNKTERSAENEKNLRLFAHFVL